MGKSIVGIIKDFHSRAKRRKRRDNNSKHSDMLCDVDTPYGKSDSYRKYLKDRII